MELELGLKVTRVLDDDVTTTSEDVWINKGRASPLFISRETDTMFLLIAHLKGCRKENIEISINEDGTRIEISGRRSVQEMVLVGWKVVKKGGEMREFFRKTFKIPECVILDEIEAKFSNDESTLTIIMPKQLKGFRGIGIEEVEENYLKEEMEAESLDEKKKLTPAAEAVELNEFCEEVHEELKSSSVEESLHQDTEHEKENQELASADITYTEITEGGNAEKGYHNLREQTMTESQEDERTTMAREQEPETTSEEVAKVLKSKPDEERQKAAEKQPHGDKDARDLIEKTEIVSPADEGNSTREMSESASKPVEAPQVVCKEPEAKHVRKSEEVYKEPETKERHQVTQQELEVPEVKQEKKNENWVPPINIEPARKAVIFPKKFEGEEETHGRREETEKENGEDMKATEGAEEKGVTNGTPQPRNNIEEEQTKAQLQEPIQTYDANEAGSNIEEKTIQQLQLPIHTQYAKESESKVEEEQAKELGSKPDEERQKTAQKLPDGVKETRALVEKTEMGSLADDGNSAQETFEQVSKPVKVPQEVYEEPEAKHFETPEQVYNEPGTEELHQVTEEEVSEMKRQKENENLASPMIMNTEPDREAETCPENEEDMRKSKERAAEEVVIDDIPRPMNEFEVNQTKQQLQEPIQTKEAESKIEEQQTKQQLQEPIQTQDAKEADSKVEEEQVKQRLQEPIQSKDANEADRVVGHGTVNEIHGGDTENPPQESESSGEQQEEWLRYLTNEEIKKLSTKSSKLCIPILAGSALLVSLIVMVFHLVRAKTRAKRSKH